MLQKTVFVETEDELKNIIDKLNSIDLGIDIKSMLVLVYANGFRKDEGHRYVNIIKDMLPDAIISGISVITSQENWSRKGASVSFMLFEKSDVAIYSYCHDEYDEKAMVEDFSNIIDGIDDLKVVLSYPVGIELDFTMVLEELTARHEDVIFFGGLAAARNYSAAEGVFVNAEQLDEEMHGPFGQLHLDEFVTGIGNDDSPESFSICNNGLIDNGCVFVTLSGKDLQEQARYVLGWKPLGIGLPITARVDSDEMGNACISEIDGSPAIDIYKKYLDVDNDEYFLDNVCEFPIIVERNGTSIARVPLYTEGNGKLHFSGDIRNGESIRLSYSNPNEIFRVSKAAADEMAGFKPEAMIMTICYNRYHYLKEDQYNEILYFMSVNPNLLYAFGGYEILKGHGCGGVLNSALIVLGLSEGEHRLCPGNMVFIPQEEESKIKPVEDRLLKFIDTSAAELEKAYAEAEAANEAKSSFLSNMSHEIRTPINAILGMNEMILRESEDDSILEYANNIRSASNSLLGIVNDILDFSKISAGKMEIIPVEYELASVLNDLINMIQKRAEDKGLQLKINVDPHIPHLLYGDEIRIKQVVTNILTNAVKYTETGGVVLGVRCDNCPDNKTIRLAFSVEDTGIGIKEEDMPRLFNSFERVDEERNRSIEGTGLGMSITENLLELMGSKLKVKSEYGVGSIFSFVLEQKVVDYTPIGDFEEALKRSLNTRSEYHESFIAPDARILVVDDTEMNLTVVKNLLKKTQIQIDTADSGFDALDMAKETKYDIIFLDHRMPKMDGIECLKLMKEDENGINFHTPVIALTANAVSGSREMYLEAGFDNYITKPIDAEALETLMSTLLPVSKVRAAKVSEEEETPLPEWISTIPFIEAEAGVKNCGGVDSFLSALKAYVDGFNENSSAIRSSMATKNLPAYTIKVHALKSSSRIIGATMIGDLAEKLEMAGNALDIKTINAYTDELLSYYSSLYYSLYHNLKIENEDDSPKPFILHEKLQEAYMAIREVSQLFDYDTVTGIIDSLREFSIPDEDKNKFNALKNAVKNADWDEINRLMKG